MGDEKVMKGPYEPPEAHLTSVFLRIEAETIPVVKIVIPAGVAATVMLAVTVLHQLQPKSKLLSPAATNGPHILSSRVDCRVDH